MNISRALFRGLGKRLPTTEGELSIDSLSASVTIRRDEYGIPHIDAGNDWDAWFGLGFCQGQDRTSQLEVMARSVRGTLSEAFGVDGLPVDRLSRRAGIRRSAEEQLAVLDGDVREMFDAFAAGVNAGREKGLSRLPHEFAIMRASPTSWDAADALGYLKFMSLAISTNWAEELARYQILIHDGPGALEALEPDRAPWLPVSNPPGASAGPAATTLIEEARSLGETLGIDEAGSNNWVVSGDRTITGRPMLANDAHLAPMLPNAFYLAHVTTPEWGVAGGNFAGTPGFFLGHNGYAAWGITVGFLDSTDLFIEEIGPDGASVREGGAFVPCEVREEHIKVRGADDLVERVLVTGRGPIVGPALDGRPGAISISATWLQPAPIRSGFSAHRWRSFDDFRDACRQHPSLSLNILYADAGGDIGWVLAGHLPQRRGSGAIPLPAREPDNHWRGQPRWSDDRLVNKNPESGYLATANNRPIPNAEAEGLGVDWLEGYRLARILEYLEERDDWDTSGMWLLQMDMESIPWRELQPVIERVRPVDGDSAMAKMMLQRWDGQVTPASSGAAVFEAFLAALLRRIAERAAPATWKWALGHGGGGGLSNNYLGSVRASQAILLAREQPPGWFPDGWNDPIAHSMGDALRQLRARRGNQTRSWNWGAARPLHLRHLLGRGPLAAVFNRGPFVIGGDTDTVHAAGVDPLQPFDRVRSIATARTVIDVGDWDNARFVLLGGQSGNPLSPHYDDQIPVWRQGRGVPIAWSPEAVEEATQSTLRLLPG